MLQSIHPGNTCSAKLCLLKIGVGVFKIKMKKMGAARPVRVQNLTRSMFAKNV